MSGVEEAALVAAVAPELIGGATAATAAGTAAAGTGAALGAGAAGAGTGLMAAEAAGTGAGMLGADAGAAGLMGGQAAMAAAPEAGAMAYTTPSIFQAAPAGGELSGTLAGTDMAYGSPTALANAPSVAPPTMMEQLGGYAKQGGKAASTFGTVNRAMGGSQPQRPPPQGRPVFQGAAPPIAQAQPQMQPQQNQYALALLEQQKRARGMLG